MWSSDLHVGLEACPADPQSLGRSAHLQEGRLRVSCEGGHMVHIRLQVAADCRVGVVQRHAAQAHGCQRAPDPQGSHLQTDASIAASCCPACVVGGQLMHQPVGCVRCVSRYTDSAQQFFSSHKCGHTQYAQPKPCCASVLHCNSYGRAELCTCSCMMLASAA